jgi:VWFA-related protein
VRPIDPRDLARRTGGLAFLDSRSVPNAIRDVLADSRVNYTLGFVAGPETFDGKFHELRVQATRPGLQVRHRDGWFAGAGNSEPLPRNRLHELLARPLDSTRVSVIARPDRERSLRVALSFNPANLGFAPGGKGMNGAIDVYCQQQDVEGRPLGSGTVASLSMSFTPEDYRKALQEGIRHTLDLEPQPGVARLRIVAHDRSTGRAGSLAIALTPLPGHDLSALPTFRAETKLALVRFRLAPKRGRLVTDLGPDDIEIREDGVVQKTSLFEGGRLYPLKSPLEISLLFDCSGSVQQAGTLDPHVFQTSLLNEYENISIGIFGFADTFVRLTSPTRDPVALQRAMNAVATVPTGGTPLFEHIANTIRDIASTPTTASRMLLIFSDGESTRPGDDGRVSEAVAAALESGVTLNPVMLLRPMGGSQLPSAQQRAPSPADPTAQPVPPRMQVETSVASFMRLAKDTGGQKFEVLLANQDVLPKILRELAARVRYEYVVGYYPQSGAGRKRRKVEVVLKRKDRGDLIGGYRTVVQ